jgi:hypothetical protein
VRRNSCCSWRWRTSTAASRQQREAAAGVGEQTAQQLSVYDTQHSSDIDTASANQPCTCYGHWLCFLLGVLGPACLCRRHTAPRAHLLRPWPHSLLLCARAQAQ